MNQDTSYTLTNTRTFAAPRVRVFDAWTNPNGDIGWWGPRDLTLPFNEKEEDAEGKLEPPQTPVTITPNERNDKTEIVFVQVGFEDTASRDGRRDGWDEAFIAVPDELARLINEAAST